MIAMCVNIKLRYSATLLDTKSLDMKVSNFLLINAVLRPHIQVLFSDIKDLNIDWNKLHANKV